MTHRLKDNPPESKEIIITNLMGDTSDDERG